MLFVLALAVCPPAQQQQQLDQAGPPVGLVPTQQRHGGFVERAAQVGLVHEVITGFDRVEGSHFYSWCQTGAGLGDFDGDGDQDVVAAGGVLPNSIWRNESGTFVDETAGAGIEVGELDHSIAIGDIDLDGDLDLFLGAHERGGHLSDEPRLRGGSRMYRNEGGFTFEDITPLTGTFGGGHTVFAKLTDLDMDGRLDLLLCEWNGAANSAWRNHGDGTFSDQTLAWGLGWDGSTHVVGVADLDRNGYPDVLWGNDFWIAGQVPGLPNSHDSFLHGLPDHTFANASTGSGVDVELATMGIAFGDVNHDGWLDVYKTEGGANQLEINHGWPGSALAYTPEHVFYGVDNPTVPNSPRNPLHPDPEGNSIGWATAFIHADLDPWLELLVVNGRVIGPNAQTNPQPFYQPNYMFSSAGPTGGFAFSDQSERFGLTDRHDDRGAAIGDLDQDGDLDMIVMPTVGMLRYYENRIAREGQGFLSVRPETRTSAPGGSGVVARWIDAGGYHHLDAVGTDAPTASQNEHLAFFGLGHLSTVDLQVEFPSGIVRSYADLAPNTTMTAVEPLLVELSADELDEGSNGTCKVTVHAHDASGEPLDAGASVTIEVPGLAPTTAVTHVHDNVFERTFQESGQQGEHRVIVTIDGWQPIIEPVLFVVGGPNIQQSTVVVAPAAVRAGSAEVARVTVAPKDAGGRSLGAGHAVEVEVVGHQSSTLATDLGDGRYVLDVAAPASSGSYRIDVNVDGFLAVGIDTLEVGGAADPAQTELYLEVPDIISQAGAHQFKFSVTPRDDAGVRLGPGAQVAVVLTPDAGSIAAHVLRADLHPAGRPKGEHFFVIEKSAVELMKPASGTAQVTVDGAWVADVPYDF